MIAPRSPLKVLQHTVEPTEVLSRRSAMATSFKQLENRENLSITSPEKTRSRESPGKLVEIGEKGSCLKESLMKQAQSHGILSPSKNYNRSPAKRLLSPLKSISTNIGENCLGRSPQPRLEIDVIKGFTDTNLEPVKSICSQSCTIDSKTQLFIGSPLKSKTPDAEVYGLSPSRGNLKTALKRSFGSSPLKSPKVAGDSLCPAHKRQLIFDENFNIST